MISIILSLIALEILFIVITLEISGKLTLIALDLLLGNPNCVLIKQVIWNIYLCVVLQGSLVCISI